jgi:hypothetical protein
VIMQYSVVGRGVAARGDVNQQRQGLTSSAAILKFE